MDWVSPRVPSCRRPEHGLSSEPRVEKWQRRLEPLQKRIGGACHLTRDPRALIEDARFAISGLETFYARARSRCRSSTAAWGRPPEPSLRRAPVAIVTVTEPGFTGNGDDLVKYVADSTQGFAFMLAGLKVLLEHGVRLNLTADRHPDGVPKR